MPSASVWKDITVTGYFSLLFLTTSLLLLACSDQQRENNLKDYVLEDAHQVEFHNYRAQLDAEFVPFPIRKGKDNDAYKRSVEGDARVFGDRIGRINQGMSVRGPSGSYSVYNGEFDFEEFATAFDSSPHLTPTEGWLGGEAWLGDNDIKLLLPEDDLLIVGDLSALRALHEARSGNGGIAVSSRGLGKVLQRTDFSSFEAEIKSECSLTSEDRGALEGCVGMSTAFTDAGEDLAEMSVVVSFDSAESASASVDWIQREIEKADEWFGGEFESTKLDIDGDTITFVANLHD